MKWYPWLYKHFKYLIDGYQAGIRHHALIVQSLPGMGDDALIYAIIRFLMCQHPIGYKNCGKCRSCELMQANTHPDYHLLKLKDDDKSIGINTIRDVVKKIYEYPCIGEAKIVWINNTSLMEKLAVTALLKILEEPPEKTWFFLSCHEPWRLQTALRSRCCLYYITVPKEECALIWLQQKVSFSQDVILAALRLCSGAPVSALELLQTNHWIQRTKLCSRLSSVLKSYDWFSLLTTLNHKDHTDIYLQWLITLLFDALKFKYGAKFIVNVDVLPLINHLSTILNSSALHSIICALCYCRKQILTINNVNIELVLTNQLLIIEHYLKTGYSSTFLPYMRGTLCI